MLSKREMELVARDTRITELNSEFGVRVESAKSAAVAQYKLGEGAAEIARLMKAADEKRERQVQDVYCEALAQTLYILEHELDIAGVRPDNFPGGISHPGYIAYRDALEIAEIAEIYSDDEPVDKGQSLRSVAAPGSGPSVPCGETSALPASEEIVRDPDTGAPLDPLFSPPKL